MASSTALQDIEDKFLQCSICLDQLNEPKVLPCLHRYCKDCLDSLIQGCQGIINCPDCREQHSIPTDGIDGFKTDFNIKSMVEFIQRQESLKDEPVQVCTGCSKRRTVTTYCFKCNDFLCDSCHDYHKTNMTLEDHRPHLFALNEVESSTLVMEKLASLKEAPKCDSHTEKPSELCCKSCDNVPICMTCGLFGKHRGHDLQEITSMAESERESLSGKLSTLERLKDNIYQVKENIAESEKRLASHVAEKIQRLQTECKIAERKITQEIKLIDEELKTESSQLLKVIKIKFSEKKNNLSHAQSSHQLYQEVCEEEQRYTEKAIDDLKQDKELQKRKLTNKLDALAEKFSKLTAGLETQQREHCENMEALSDHLDGVMKRCEVVTATASSILSTRHAWTEVQCIPDICTAVDSLADEMGKDYVKEIESLSDVKLETLSSSFTERGKEGENSGASLSLPFVVVEVEKIKSNEWNINGIDCWSEDRSIVITGEASSSHSHVTVVDDKGVSRRCDILKSQSRCAWRYCSFLSQVKVATVVHPTEIGIYDIRSGSYVRKDISEAVETSSEKLHVTSVATDPENDYVIVGTNSRDVYVFNSQLSYSHRVTLPVEIKEPTHLTYRKGSLFVCDVNGKTACAITIHGRQGKLAYEFAPPDVDNGNWTHRSLCVDKSGFVYMIWSAKIGKRRKRLLVKYDKDSGCQMNAALLEGDGNCVTTFDADDRKQIVVASYSGGSLHFYDMNLR